MTAIERDVLFNAVHGELGAAVIQMIDSDDGFAIMFGKLIESCPPLLTDANGKEEGRDE